MPLYFRQCLYCTLSLSHVFGESYPCAYKDKITFARGSFWISVSRFLQHKNAKPRFVCFFFFLHWFSLVFGFLELTGCNLGTFSATIISNIHSEIFFYVFLLLIQLMYILISCFIVVAILIFSFSCFPFISGRNISIDMYSSSQITSSQLMKISTAFFYFCYSLF